VQVGLALVPLAITLAVAPAQLKIDAATPPATVTVTAPGVRALRLWCSTGSLSKPTALGDDRFGASYAPPATGKPTWALLVAWDEEGGEAATATLALGARTEIPVDTEAGAQVVALVHGRRSTARANAAGHARVFAWVWPGEHTATVTALDAAGNATTNEVALELPRPDGVFLLAPATVAADAPVRVYAFATGAATPQLSAAGATLSSGTARPAFAGALMRAHADVTLVATAGDERVEQRIRVAAATPPPERSIALTPALPRWAQLPPPSSGVAPPPSNAPVPSSEMVRAAVEPSLSRWELGASASGRYSGAFLGFGGTIEARRRLGRFAVGVDLDGRWASGTLASDQATLGGLAARAAFEARFAVAARASLFVGAAVGGHWARLRRTPPARAVFGADDGGPTLAGGVGVLARLGPGLLQIAVGYAWSPLVGNALANVDGVALTVGYRAARWPRRRAGGRRPARRRRRAPGR
jgi:hypothetical protein